MTAGRAGPAARAAGVRTWQRTGLTHSLASLQALGPGPAGPSSTSPIADLGSTLPPLARHLGQVSGPPHVGLPPAETAERGAPPLGPSVHCLPTQSTGCLGVSLEGQEPCCLPPAARPPPAPPAKVIQLSVPSHWGNTSPLLASSAEERQVQEREAWVWNFPSCTLLSYQLLG